MNPQNELHLLRLLDILVVSDVSNKDQPKSHT